MAARHLWLLSILMTGACDKIAEFTNPGVGACKTFVSDHLKAPSTLHIVSLNTSERPISMAEWDRLHGGIFESTGRRIRADNPAMSRVSIEYDSANSFGTPIRGMQVCDFPVRRIGETPWSLEAKQMVEIVEGKENGTSDSPLKCCAEAFAKDK